MHIGILQSGQAPEVLKGQYGDYPDLFVKLLADRGFTFQSWHVEGMEFPDSPRDADGWLITGSKHGAYDDLPFIPPLEDFIRSAKSMGVPMVGICFGHQIMAQALGGKVAKFDGGWSVGAQDYVIEGQPLVLNAWHQDQVVALPEGAETVGTSQFCQNAALSYGDWGWSVQPHPEFGDEFVQGLIDHRAKGVVPPELLARAESRMGGEIASSVIADRIEAFFKMARQRVSA
ncbi:type 1 glutamine amidotransferase [Paracoccus pacificus]|uniref:Type 1 glutamine amidotransferase n=1 Tax=Paracoccus pacificus TaxID=1463598 RepID=A0ABW4RAJ3_9RHOB